MKGILINTEYCTGCHSCEVACRKELGLGKGEWGIKLTETGPWKYETGKAAGQWEWTWTPVITKACDMCEGRVARRIFTVFEMPPKLGGGSCSEGGPRGSEPCHCVDGAMESLAAV